MRSNSRASSSLTRALATLAVSAVVGMSVAGPASAGETLDAVKARGVLKCGTMLDTPGYGFPDSNGVPRGMDVDFCRALAAAVLGDPSKVDFVPLTTQTRFPALQSKEVDVLFRETTITFTRDTALGFLSGPYTVIDGQGMMVPKKLGVTKPTDLDGATVCVVPGSNSELNVGDFFATHNMKFTPISIENMDDMRRAFFAGRCDVFTADRTFLGSIRSVAQNPDDYVVLDETIAKSPLGPQVRQGDDQWYNIVRWVVFAPMIAEEMGITSANAADMADKGGPNVKRLLGKQAGFSKGLGIGDDWALNLIKAVGNYEEMYERNLGMKSALKLKRGENNLYNKGGLLYAPPML